MLVLSFLDLVILIYPMTDPNGAARKMVLHGSVMGILMHLGNLPKVTLSKSSFVVQKVCRSKSVSKERVLGVRTSASSKYDGTNSGASAPKTSMANFKPVMPRADGMSLDDG